ncbi:MAG: bifunctional riboflavin kinase/FAD synthetase [Synechococcales cyanobacterium]
MECVVKSPTVVAIGNFDGIHRGHQQVLSPVLRQTEGIKTVLTFDPHPRQFFSQQTYPLLTPLAEKTLILQEMGIDQVIALPFTAALAGQSASEFMDTILRERLQAQMVSVGWDFCFGAQRSGNAQVLREWGHTHGIPIHVVPEMTWHGQSLRSSRIRQVLQEGNVEQAQQWLGRRYALIGVVVPGSQRGRVIGFPTANLQVPPEKFLPSDGVYAGWVDLADEQGLPAVLNIGVRPTVETQGARTVEVHLLDWQGSLYGQELRMQLVSFLRPEQRFPSLEALQAQLGRDCAQARQILATVTPRQLVS